MRISVNTQCSQTRCHSVISRGRGLQHSQGGLRVRESAQSAYWAWQFRPPGRRAGGAGDRSAYDRQDPVPALGLRPEVLSVQHPRYVSKAESARGPAAILTQAARRLSNGVPGIAHRSNPTGTHHGHGPSSASRAGSCQDRGDWTTAIVVSRKMLQTVVGKPFAGSPMERFQRSNGATPRDRMRAIDRLGSGPRPGGALNRAEVIRPGLLRRSATPHQTPGLVQGAIAQTDPGSVGKAANRPFNTVLLRTPMALAHAEPVAETAISPPLARIRRAATITPGRVTLPRHSSGLPRLAGQGFDENAAGFKQGFRSHGGYVPSGIVPGTGMAPAARTLAHSSRRVPTVSIAAGPAGAARSEGFAPQSDSQADAGARITLRGDVILDARRIGRMVASGQVSGAKLPAGASSAINLRALPVFPGSRVPL